MKIAFLTSSRADFGIYLPLLKALKADPFFDVGIIAFGTHLSSFHGHTIDGIVDEGFRIDHRVETVMSSDTKEAVATSMAITAMKFTSIWQKGQQDYDLVFCLGDRYEMFAAISTAVPFQIPFAHIHGGETTFGAIDNEFRHCLTLFSSLHFVAAEPFAARVKEIKGCDKNIHTVGALSLDNLEDLELLNYAEFKEKFGIDLSIPTILVTYHPETVAISSNEKNVQELVRALTQLSEYQVVITMPNADTMGNVLRNVYGEYGANNNKVHLVENFGTRGYFTAMKYSQLIVGNSSSGIIEAASLGKYVVNIGDRQKGRLAGDNVLHCQGDATAILNACQTGLQAGIYKKENIYYKGGAVKKIIEVLKNESLKCL